VTNDEREHLGKVADLCCILCRRSGIFDSPAEIHHIRSGIGAGRRASHYDTIPLCPPHHRISNEALHVMGRKRWEIHHGVTELELLAQVKELLKRG